MLMFLIVSEQDWLQDKTELLTASVLVREQLHSQMAPRAGLVERPQVESVVGKQRLEVQLSLLPA